ncbi:cytochrome C biogenesis protein CcmH [Rhodobacterales bacterium 52_120_T64]|nr:cytochrome C biogenesis protein CcmH [Rhodobacterales bacterium 52_120_T64]
MKHQRIRTAIATLLILVIPILASAVEPDEILDDPVLEERAREISAEVRCVVCQNESIDSSNADIARDLRILVRERLVAGDSDEEVFEFLVARYGDYVLFRPPWKAETYILWLTPFVILGIGGLSILVMLMKLRSKKPAAGERLNEDEEVALDEILKDGKKGTQL